MDTLLDLGVLLSNTAFVAAKQLGPGIRSLPPSDLKKLALIKGGFFMVGFFQGVFFFKGVLLREGYSRAAIKGVFLFKGGLFKDGLSKGAFGEASMPHSPLGFRFRQN